MSGSYLGSPKLQCHFKMFRVRYSHRSQCERIKEEVMQLMNDYLEHYDGYPPTHIANLSTSRISLPPENCWYTL